MAQNGKVTSLAQLVSELKAMCQKGDSGKLFVNTSTNGFAQFSLKEGQVVAISYGNKKGAEALDAMSVIESATLVFMPGTISSQETMALPPNDVIFNQLSTTGPAVEPPTPVAGAEPAAGLSQEVKEQLQQILANYIGPMAGAVCAKVLPTVSDSQAAIETLAAQIPDSKRAQAFQTEALKQF